MSEQVLTHWKKNNDPRYISGEDLRDGIAIGKGLRPEMVVTIAKFEDKETFDQQSQSKVIKSGMFLREYPSGKPLYKPMILNNTNAKFCINEFKSEFLEHWLDKPVVLWGMPDKRHVVVARFKKYYPPATVTDTSALAKLSECKTQEDLVKAWTSLTPAEKNLPTVLGKKESLKTTLPK